MRWIVGLILSCTALFAEEETIKPPKSFAKEVLQPFIMPLVTTYHAIRENPFLNISREDATGLEQLGDLFLAPSRYLFGGKNVFLVDGTYEMTPSFNYEKYDLIKSALFVVALPICEVLGCTLKGLSFLSKETRQEYGTIKQSLRDKTLSSKFHVYRRLGISNLHSKNLAPCLGLVRPTILSEVHQKEVEAFREVSELLNEHGIIFWLDCGSCLGAYRYGGMIPWDSDIDISILSPDHINVRKVLSKLDSERFQIQDWSSYKYPQTFLKLYLKETKTYIDIYQFDINPENRTLAYFYTFKDSLIPDSWKRVELAMTKPIPYDTVFPLNKATFDGIVTWVPNQLEAYLHYEFGSNLSPTMVWDEKTQAYLKVKDHPYWKLVE
jgi:phosphorylcholine metabolism protein LicD